MIVAQAIIAFPLVAGLTMSAVAGVDPAVRSAGARAGGVAPSEAWTVLREARVGVTAAIVAAFGGIISEVGAVMLVGGNIEGQTRVLTTAIVLYTRQGDFALAMALGRHPDCAGLRRQRICCCSCRAGCADPCRPPTPSTASSRSGIATVPASSSTSSDSR